MLKLTYITIHFLGSLLAAAWQAFSMTTACKR